MKQTYHYTYRITNIKLNKHYYGVRTCHNRLPKDDIGIYYFSSSRDEKFLNDQKDNPMNYKYKVLCLFSNRIKASLYEIKIHDKFNVSMSESFYNIAKATSVGWDTTGRRATVTQRENLSKAKKFCFDKNLHNTSIRVKIYNSLGIEQFDCFGNFRKTVKENNLPLKLQDSYKNNGEPIFTKLTKNHLSRLVNRGADKYIGWYAIKMD